MVLLLGTMNVVHMLFRVKQILAATRAPVTGSAASQASVKGGTAEAEDQPMLVSVTLTLYTRRNGYESQLVW